MPGYFYWAINATGRGGCEGLTPNKIGLEKTAFEKNIFKSRPKKGGSNPHTLTTLTLFVLSMKTLTTLTTLTHQ